MEYKKSLRVIPSVFVLKLYYRSQPNQQGNWAKQRPAAGPSKGQPAILSFHSPNVRLRSDLKCKVLPYINILQENGCPYRDPCKVSPYINIIQENGCVYRDTNKVSPYIKNNSCLYREPCKVTPYIGILYKNSIHVRCHLK